MRALRLVLVICVCLAVHAPAAAQERSPTVQLTRVATLDQPLAMAVRSADDTLYVAEKTGRIRAIRGGMVDPRSVLDLSGEVSTGGEQGFLGLAFSPDGERLYVDFTDLSGDTHVVEFGFSGGRADTSTRRELLFVEQPFANHNGGTLAFGPDGNLYVGLGDGGGSGDPQENAQRLDTLLGKILRIDPSGDPYSIPPDNPFVGTPGARDEIWAYGLRNPWKFSFDRRTGDLWIGDVGERQREEIDFEAASSAGGANYGWDVFEGTLRFEQDDPEPPDHVLPVHEYPRSGGACAVTGGYVYRGSAVPGLVGAYVFGDFCTGRVEQLRRTGSTVEVSDLGITVDSLAAFGEDASGELYALSLDGDVFRLDPTASSTPPESGGLFANLFGPLFGLGGFFTGLTDFGGLLGLLFGGFPFG